MKTVPNLITSSRILCAGALFCVVPLSAAFWTLYALCGISDVLDGYVARRTGQTGSFGAKLDSAADFLFVCAVLGRLIPIFPWESRMLLWIGAIAIIRFATFAIGLAKYGAFAWLHTIANKAAGAAMFFAPAIWQIAGSGAAVLILCTIAGLSAIEELLITLRRKELKPDIKSIFCR